jgi:hypothetical protein
MSLSLVICAPNPLTAQRIVSDTSEYMPVCLPPTVLRCTRRVRYIAQDILYYQVINMICRQLGLTHFRHILAQSLAPYRKGFEASLWQSGHQLLVLPKDHSVSQIGCTYLVKAQPEHDISPIGRLTQLFHIRSPPARKKEKRILACRVCGFGFFLITVYSKTYHSSTPAAGIIGGMEFRERYLLANHRFYSLRTL